MAANKSLTILLGAGPGTGAAIARAATREGSAVALLARSAQSLEQIADELKQAGGDAAPFSCDATSEASIAAAFDAIQQRWPDHKVDKAFFNATNPFIVKPFLELEPKDLKPGLDLNVYGAFYFSKKAVPLLLDNGGGFLCFSGATAALKGSAKFAAFAPAKFALRGMAQSLAREFGPQGVHVSHVILDGLIDTDRVKGFAGQGEPGTRMSPDSIAESLLYLSKQPKDCWTHELDLRPSAEKW
ncbi:hypothetical protein JCM10212_005022 [Sporobolomyces blumeae]